MQSLYFYDLETTGVNPRNSRIMQFGGQRTDLELNPIGEPINVLIKLTDDILPEPDAILVTGITPQKTIAEGITEAEFVKLFDGEINLPETIFVGFNSIRFDDEFMRFLFWRNFYDPYEWQWKDGRSRWDILDVSRMTRALRPDGIQWPFTPEGKPTNSLQFLTSVNKLDHKGAHDALADVKATISMAKLIKANQPKLFDYLLNLRGKKAVAKFLDENEIFLYSSGKYSGEFEKTSVATVLGDHPDNGKGKLVYDLRHDPKQYIDLPPEKLADLWKWKKNREEPQLPVKALQLNRCPALAPLSVLDEPSQTRLKIDLKQIQTNLKTLRSASNFNKNLLKAIEILNKDRVQSALINDAAEVDRQLYDRFVDGGDKNLLPDVRQSSPDNLGDLATKFRDERLKNLLPLYKARNYPKSLSTDEMLAWEEFRKQALGSGGEQSRLAKFGQRLGELTDDKLGVLTDEKRYLLEELRLYAESILPEA